MATLVEDYHASRTEMPGAVAMPLVGTCASFPLPAALPIETMSLLTVDSIQHRIRRTYGDLNYLRSLCKRSENRIGGRTYNAVRPHGQTSADAGGDVEQETPTKCR